MSSIYLDNKYLSHFDKIAEDAIAERIGLKSTNLFSIAQLFNVFSVYTNMSNSEIKRTFLSENTDRIKYSSLLVKTAIKKGKLIKCSTEKLSTPDFGCFYFTCQESSNLTSDFGIIAKDVAFTGNDYFNIFSRSDVRVENNWEEIKDVFAPCSAMLIIDKYIFGNPFKNKLEGLYSFILAQKRPQKVPFHLSILTSYENRGNEITNERLVAEAFVKLKEIPGIELEIILHNKFDIDDRLILTDYTSSNIGHPFDGRRTRYNQKFLAFEMDSSSIVRNYQAYAEELQVIKKIFDSVKAKIGLMQYKWPIEGINNRLFNFKWPKDITSTI